MTTATTTATTWTKDTLGALSQADLRQMAKDLGVAVQRRSKDEIIADVLAKIAIDAPSTVTSTIDPDLQAKLEEQGAKIEIRGGKPFVRVPKDTAPENIEKIGELVEGTNIKALYEGQKTSKKAAKRKPKSNFVVGELTKAGAEIVAVDEENKTLTIKCTEPLCQATRTIHYQDAFQVKHCQQHAKFHFRKRRADKAKAARADKAAKKAAEVKTEVANAK